MGAPDELGASKYGTSVKMLRGRPKMKTQLVGFVAFLILALAGCTRENKAPDADNDDASGLANLPDLPFDRAVKEGLSGGGNHFGLDIYGRLRARAGNLLFSPHSISVGLAMAYAGARGKTAQEIAEVMHFPRDQHAMCPAYTALLKEIHSAHGRDRQLYSANGLFGQKDLGFKNEYLETLRTHYGAELQEVDFIHAPEQARQTINAWVADKTRNKVREILGQGALDENVGLVLTNAVYFKGKWARAFKAAQTGKGDFWITPKNKVAVQMMRQEDDLPYLEDEGVQILELPYAGKGFSMVVFLPTRKDGLPALERSLTAKKLDRWLAGLAVDRVQVILPRFRLASELALKEPLQALGMKEAFDHNADFSGIATVKPLFLLAVTHKAFIEVNEEGTEAAAATIVEEKKGREPERQRFRADHPFLFLVRDRRSGTILFLGRVTDPRQAPKQGDD
jgi:serpin B